MDSVKLVIAALFYIPIYIVALAFLVIAVFLALVSLAIEYAHFFSECCVDRAYEAGDFLCGLYASMLEYTMGERR